MFKYALLSIAAVLSSCVNITTTVVNDEQGRYEIEVGYGHFHFGPDPDDAPKLKQ
jgi:hypothetical protein